MKILEIKNVVPEIRNSQDGFSNTKQIEEKRISEFEHRLIKVIQYE